MGWLQFLQRMLDYWGFSLNHRNPHPEFTRGFLAGGHVFTPAELEALGAGLSVRHALTAPGSDFGGSGANVETVLPSGSFSIPAGTLSAGKVVHARFVLAIPTVASENTLSVAVRLGGLSGALALEIEDLAVASGDMLILDIELVIRSATTALATGRISGLVNETGFAAGAFKAVSGLNLASALVLAVTGKWSTTAANAVRVESLTVFLA